MCDGSEFLAQALDVCVNRPCVERRRQFPDLFKQLTATAHLAFTRGQEDQELVLGARELDLFTLNPDAMRAVVDAERSVRDQR